MKLIVRVAKNICCERDGSIVFSSEYTPNKHLVYSNLSQLKNQPYYWENGSCITFISQSIYYRKLFTCFQFSMQFVTLKIFSF